MTLGGITVVRVFRRTVIVMAVALISFALVIPLSASAAARASCSPVLFLGAHGVGEGSSGTKPDSAHWGASVQAVWHTFYQNGVDAVAEAVSYKRVPAPSNLKSKKDAVKWLVGSFTPSSISGNKSLINEMTNTYSACPRTLFVLAGYSQGAWIIDYVLHYFKNQKGHGGIPIGRKILANIRGVFLMGDPGWPKTTQNPKLEGLVTYYGSYVKPLLPNSVYPAQKDYLANGLPTADFSSICAGGDPVCHYDGSLKDLEANVGIHEHAYTNGNPSAADDGGNWLATRIGGSAG